MHTPSFRHLFQWAALLSLILTSPLQGVEAQAAPPPAQKELPPPDLFTLTPDWFDYFEVKPDQLEEKVQTWTMELEQVLEGLSEEVAEKAKALLKKSLASLNALVNTKHAPTKPNPPIDAFLDRYTVSELISLYRKMENLSSDVASQDEDLEEKERQITSGQTQLSQLRRKYNIIESPTNEKALLALEIIDLRLSIELAKQNVKQLKVGLKHDREKLANLRQEVEFATAHLYTSKEKEQAAKDELNSLLKVAQKEKGELQSVEAMSISQFIFPETTEREKLQNQALSQKVIEATLSDALAMNAVIAGTLKLLLIELITDPDQIDLDTFSQSVAKEVEVIETLRENIKDWERVITRHIERTESALSNLKEDDPFKKRELEELLISSERSLVSLFRLKSELKTSEFLIEILNTRITDIRGGIRDFIEGIWVGIKRTYRWIARILSKPLFSIGDTTFSAGLFVELALIIFVVVWLAKLLSYLLKNVLHKRVGVKASLVYRLTRLMEYVLIAFGILVALTTIGFDLSNFVLIAGALGVGLGFGLQSLFNNFVSGIIILFENQLKVGDYVELESGVKGEVKEINVRSTFVHTNDGIDIIVPNAEFTSARVINWTMKEPYRRVQVPFAVSYKSDKEEVKRVVKEAVKKVPFTLDKPWIPEPRIYIVEFGPSSIEFKAVVWVDETVTKRSSFTQSAYLWAIHEALTKNEIEIPYPQLDLHVKSLFEKNQLSEIVDSWKD